MLISLVHYREGAFLMYAQNSRLPIEEFHSPYQQKSPRNIQALLTHHRSLSSAVHKVFCFHISFS